MQFYCRKNEIISPLVQNLIYTNFSLKCENETIKYSGNISGIATNLNITNNAIEPNTNKYLARFSFQPKVLNFRANNGIFETSKKEVINVIEINIGKLKLK